MHDISAKKLKHYWPVYLLVLPPLLLVLVFSYYPIYNGFVHIFYSFYKVALAQDKIQAFWLFYVDRFQFHSCTPFERAPTDDSTNC